MSIGSQSPGVGDGDSFELDGATAARFADATLYIERQFRGKPPRGGGRFPPPIGARWFRATSSISAGSSSAYGTGTARVLYDNGTKLDTTADATSYATKNRVEKTIASGADFLGVWANGSWWVAVVDNCSHLS